LFQEGLGFNPMFGIALLGVPDLRYIYRSIASFGPIDRFLQSIEGIQHFAAAGLDRICHYRIARRASSRDRLDINVHCWRLLDMRVMGRPLPRT
jgi:hypothetical protein